MRPEAVAADDRVPFALLGGVGGIDDRAQVESRLHGEAEPGDVHGSIEHPLRRAHDLRGRPRKAVGKAIDLRGERVRGHDAVDQPDPLTFRGVDEVAGQQQLPGPLLADQERHQQRHGRRPVADLRLTELRALGRDDEVAGHRELEAAGQRIPMHLRDHGLGRVKEPERGRDIGRQQLAPGHGAADRALGFLGQVVAGREGPAGALEDDDPDAVVGFCFVEGGHECGNEFAVEGVELRRAVQPEPDAPWRSGGEEHGLVRHRSPPPVPQASAAGPARPVRRPRVRPALTR